MESETTIVYTVHVDGRPRASIVDRIFPLAEHSLSILYFYTEKEERVQNRISGRGQQRRRERNRVTLVFGAWAESAASGSVILQVELDVFIAPGRQATPPQRLNEY